MPCTDTASNANATIGTTGNSPAAVSFAAVSNGFVPPGWLATAGDCGMQDGVLVGRNSGTDGWAPSGLVTGSADATDYALRLRFQVRQYGGGFRDGAWTGFRCTRTGDCCALAFQHGLVLYKFHQGTGTNDSVQLAKAGWAYDTAWHDLAVSVKGKCLDVTLDGARAGCR